MEKVVTGGIQSQNDERKNVGRVSEGYVKHM